MEQWFLGYFAIPLTMDPVRAPITSSTARQTVLVGASGSAWPFVPRKLSGAFFFDYDPQHGSVTWCSGNSFEVLGMSDAACTLHGAFLLAHLHPGDRYRVESNLHLSMQSLQPFVTSYRWYRPDSNEYRVMHCRAMLDSEAQLLRGFIIDLSDQLVTLQGECDHLAALSFSFDQLGKKGLIIDVEFRIRSVHTDSISDAFSLGLGQITHTSICPGTIFSAAFTNPLLQDQVQDLLAETVCTGHKKLDYGSCSAELRVIAVDGVPHGISIEINDRSNHIALDAARIECTSLRLALNDQRKRALKLVNSTQEMVGFAALISRYAVENPLLRHASEALIATAKGCSKEASEVVEHHQRYIQEAPVQNLPVPTPLITGARSKQNRTRTTEVLVASNTLRAAQTLAALLRDSGVGAVGTRLAEPELKEVIQSNPHTRIVVLDLSGDIQQDSILIRRIHRFFPATQIVCISREGAEVLKRLRRAGAALVLTKPATPREVERAVRQLLT